MVTTPKESQVLKPGTEGTGDGDRGEDRVEEPASPGVTQILDSTRQFGSRMFGMFRTRWQQQGDQTEVKDVRTESPTPAKVQMMIN